MNNRFYAVACVHYVLPNPFMKCFHLFDGVGSKTNLGEGHRLSVMEDNS